MYLIEVEVLLYVIVPEVARLRVLMRVRHVGDVANSCGISNTCKTKTTMQPLNGFQT